MIRALDSSSQRFLADLERIQQRVNRAQRQISSGLRIAEASDGPDQVGELLAAKARLDRGVEIRLTLARVKAEVDTGEQALQSAVRVLERALTLGVQGANATQTPASRRTLGTEVQALLEQMVALAATRVEGRYIFSGDADQTAPYTLDLAAPNGVSAYAGAQATREILHPAGTRFRIARSGQEIFEDPAAGVFAALNALRTALENGPSVPPGDPDYQTQFDAQTAAIEQALTDLRKAHEHLDVELGFYGTLENKVEEALNFAQRLEIREQNLLSAIRDADVTEAALALSQATTHQQAALAARARMRRGSLFDYLG